MISKLVRRREFERANAITEGNLTDSMEGTRARRFLSFSLMEKKIEYGLNYVTRAIAIRTECFELASTERSTSYEPRMIVG